MALSERKGLSCHRARRPATIRDHISVGHRDLSSRLVKPAVIISPVVRAIRAELDCNQNIATCRHIVRARDRSVFDALQVLNAEEQDRDRAEGARVSR